jgi:hypothetical protein
VEHSDFGQRLDRASLQSSSASRLQAESSIAWVDRQDLPLDVSYGSTIFGIWKNYIRRTSHSLLEMVEKISGERSKQTP